MFSCDLMLRIGPQSGSRNPELYERRRHPPRSNAGFVSQTPRLYTAGLALCGQLEWREFHCVAFAIRALQLASSPLVARAVPLGADGVGVTIADAVGAARFRRYPRIESMRRMFHAAPSIAESLTSAGPSFFSRTHGMPRARSSMSVGSKPWRVSIVLAPWERDANHAPMAGNRPQANADSRSSASECSLRVSKSTMLNGNFDCR